MDVEINFSFLKFFNHIKNVNRALQPDQYDPNWIRKGASKETQARFKRFYDWCKKEGIWHPKVKYPVMFGSGDSKYPGMLALDDIGQNETIVKVPSRLIISTKAAYECQELQKIFYDNPDIFGKHISLGDDNVLDAYILYHINQGQKSKHYEMMQCWPSPNETDILMNWGDSDLEWLQDQTLTEEAVKGYEDFSMQWDQLYRCLRNYPDLFPESAIGLNKFKYVYILTTNRCFSSNWPGVSQMVPFADYVNHENVDTGFDCVDEFGLSLNSTKQKEESSAYEKWRECQEETRDSVFNMKRDMLDLEIELRQRLLEGGVTTQTVAEQQDQVMDLKVLSHVQQAFKVKEMAKKKDEECDYSSGLSSDGDIDMLTEMEVLRSKKKSNIVDKERITLDAPKDKDEAQAIWLKSLESIPSEYEFQIQTGKDIYPKGSQIYICYGRMSNREMLKRYGFCLNNNKYNNVFIRLKLQLQDPDFKYRYYIMQKFFQVDIEADHIIAVQSRHFKVYYQKLNTKMLKFVKIINFNVKSDDIATVLESRSLSLEYISFQKLKGVYEDFLNNYPTSLQEDLELMRDQNRSKNLNVRQYMAMVYRTEQKRILINQIKLVKIVMTIIERMMRGATLEFAVLRVHEFESAKDHIVNRIMMKTYLDSLQKGLKQNTLDFYNQKGLSQEDGEQLLREVQKEMRKDVSKTAYKQFEIKGYERMISRIMEGSLHQNPALHESFLSVQEALQKQKEINEKIEIQMEEKIKLQQKIESDSYYDSEYESEDDKLDQIKSEWQTLQQQANQEQADEMQIQTKIIASEIEESY